MPDDFICQWKDTYEVRRVDVPLLPLTVAGRWHARARAQKGNKGCREKNTVFRYQCISISVESFSSVAEEVYLRGPKVPPQFLLLLYLLTFFVPGDHQEAKMTPDTTKFFKFT
jgi:hypothetical protein